jgi:hypothetical protein
MSRPVWPIALWLWSATAHAADPLVAGDLGSATPHDAPSDAVDAELPQTEGRPHADERTDRLARALFDAIRSDTPEKARAFFFPLAAYRQVKAIQHPEADWHNRLIAAYDRDIHALAASLPADAAFVGLRVADPSAHWVNPGQEWNKLGYFRVFGTRLVYQSGGATHTIPIKSMISWRGRWYVVHLSGYR